jgi:transcriptional regulator with GAF, ATPase, and Fis domain
MRWDLETRYKILLEINNAIATRKSKDELFQALSKELFHYFAYDRMCIILYDSQSKSINYFAAADGIQPGGVIARESRPLADGAIAKIAINSGQPAIFDDLTRYADLSSVGELLKVGLTSTMVFPLIIRSQTLGTIHLSYRKSPQHISELTEFLKAVSQQIAIAVDNMLAYTALKQSNLNLQEERHYLLHKDQDYKDSGFFYDSLHMRQVLQIIGQVADTDETILIVGETGTGKDFLARLIHDKSKRANNLFVKTNCPGLTSSLFESELFGHAKGAFTGADRQRRGRFELANEGTIFLDEVGELPMILQAKLLQVLQERRFERVGESRSIDVDVRIISATNQDLLKNVQEGSFRQDLFYRLETVTIHVPPLRERREDIPLLIHNINLSEAERMHKVAPVYSEDAIDLLTSYNWPGNVRELKNLVKRLIILRPGAIIKRKEIEQTFPLTMSAGHHGAKLATLEQAERDHILQVLAATKGVIGGKGGAAQFLGVPRSTLQYRIKKLGIQSSEYSP